MLSDMDSKANLDPPTNNKKPNGVVNISPKPELN